MLKDALVSDLKTDEGWRGSAYEDHLGFLTIGYGFLIDERRGGAIPEAVAEFWLKFILERNADELVARIPWIAAQPEPVQRALQNMAYQLGVNGLMQFRKTLAALRAGDYNQAADEALDSRWARQTPNRAARVVALFREAER
jgi:lysozyme